MDWGSWSASLGRNEAWEEVEVLCVRGEEEQSRFLYSQSVPTDFRGEEEVLYSLLRKDDWRKRLHEHLNAAQHCSNRKPGMETVVGHR